MVLYQTWFMTLPAIDASVLAEQRKAHPLVRKAFLGGRPLDQLKISPLMLVMTSLAALVRCGDAAMKASPVGKLCFELAVT